MKHKPTWVPIPPIEITCKKHCCTYKYISLSIAYARTGHTFQGQNVGPNYDYYICSFLGQQQLELQKTDSIQHCFSVVTI